MATSKRWSKHVTETSDAMDVAEGTFKQKSPAKIAHAVEGDARRSTRKKSGDFQAAISMLTFYINRAGDNLSAAQRKVLEQAKDIIREDYGRPPAAPKKSSAKKSTAKKKTAKKAAKRPRSA